MTGPTVTAVCVCVFVWVCGVAVYIFTEMVPLV